jgi:hypothetical protein
LRRTNQQREGTGAALVIQDSLCEEMKHSGEIAEMFAKIFAKTERHDSERGHELEPVDAEIPPIRRSCWRSGRKLKQMNAMGKTVTLRRQRDYGIQEDIS